MPCFTQCDCQSDDIQAALLVDVGCIVVVKVIVRVNVLVEKIVDVLVLVLVLLLLLNNQLIEF